MPGLNTKRERESVRKRGSVCELEERERGMDGERGGKQCQVRNAEPVSMEQLFVIRKHIQYRGQSYSLHVQRKWCETTYTRNNILTYFLCVYVIPFYASKNSGGQKYVSQFP